MEGDPDYGGNRCSSIPFVVEVPSDEEGEELDMSSASLHASQTQQQMQYSQHSLDNGFLDDDRFAEGTNQHSSRSQRRISQVSMGSEFEGIIQELDSNSNLGHDGSIPKGVKHFQYVMPLAASSSDDEEMEAISNTYRSNYYRNQRKPPLMNRSNNSSSSSSGGPNNQAKAGNRSMGAFDNMMLPPSSAKVDKAPTSAPVSSLQAAAAGMSYNRINRTDSAGSQESASVRKADNRSSLQRRLSELKAQQDKAEDVLIRSRETSPLTRGRKKTLNLDVGAMGAPKLRRTPSRDNSPVHASGPSRRNASISLGNVAAIKMASSRLLRSRDTSPVQAPRINSRDRPLGLVGSRDNSPMRGGKGDVASGRSSSFYGQISEADKNKNKRRGGTNLSDRLKFVKEAGRSLEESIHSHHSTRMNNALPRNSMEELNQSRGSFRQSLARHQLDLSQHSSQPTKRDRSDSKKDELQGSLASISVSNLPSQNEEALPAAAAAAAMNRSKRMRKHADRKERLHMVLLKMNQTVPMKPPVLHGSGDKGHRSFSERVKDYSSSDDEGGDDFDSITPPVLKSKPSVLLEPSNDHFESSFANVGGVLTNNTGGENMERKLSAVIPTDSSELNSGAHKRFPSTVPNLGAAAGLPMDFMTQLTAAGMLQDDKGDDGDDSDDDYDSDNDDDDDDDDDDESDYDDDDDGDGLTPANAMSSKAPSLGTAGSMPTDFMSQLAAAGVNSMGNNTGSNIDVGPVPTKPVPSRSANLGQAESMPPDFMSQLAAAKMIQNNKSNSAGGGDDNASTVPVLAKPAVSAAPALGSAGGMPTDFMSQLAAAGMIQNSKSVGGPAPVKPVSAKSVSSTAANVGSTGGMPTDFMSQLGAAGMTQNSESNNAGDNAGARPVPAKLLPTEATNLGQTGGIPVDFMSQLAAAGMIQNSKGITTGSNASSVPAPTKPAVSTTTTLDSARGMPTDFMSQLAAAGMMQNVKDTSVGGVDDDDDDDDSYDDDDDDDSDDYDDDDSDYDDDDDDTGPALTKLIPAAHPAGGLPTDFMSQLAAAGMLQNDKNTDSASNTDARLVSAKPVPSAAANPGPAGGMPTDFMSQLAAAGMIQASEGSTMGGKTDAVPVSRKPALSTAGTASQARGIPTNFMSQLAAAGMLQDGKGGDEDDDSTDYDDDDDDDDYSDDDDEDSADFKPKPTARNTKRSDTGAAAATNPFSHFVDSLVRESKKEDDSVRSGSSRLLGSVASTVLLDPSSTPTPDMGEVEGDELSSTLLPLDNSFSSAQSGGLSEKTRSSHPRHKSIGSVVEELPREDASTAATPFFGAALRQLQVLRKMTGSSDARSVVSESSNNSVSSFANDDSDNASITLTSDAGAAAAWNNRGPLLDKIDEANGNESRASGEFSCSPSEELDDFDADHAVNPIEQKLLDQRNEMFTDAQSVGRRDSMVSQAYVPRDCMGRRDSMLSQSMGRRDSMLSTTSSQSTSSARTTGNPRRAGSRPLGARRASMVNSPLMRRTDIAFRGDSSFSSASEFKFSSGTSELANIQLDDTLPPQTTRRNVRKDKRDTSIAKSVQESVSIESAAIAMASAGGRTHRRSRQRNSEGRRGSRVSSGGGSLAEKAQGRRGTGDSIDLDAFEEFNKIGQSINSDDMDVRSAASSIYSRADRKEGKYETRAKAKRSLSMYHSKDAKNALEDAERNERAWAAMFHGHGVMLESTGQRPVLKRMYRLGIAFVVIATCFLILLVLINNQGNRGEPIFPDDSFCGDADIPESLRRCPCDDFADFLLEEGFLQRYEEIWDIMIVEGVVNADDLDNDIESCESVNVAMQWLAEDQWDLDSEVDLTVQRFVFGLFFVELDGIFWIDSDGWMTNLDVCEWLGTSCSRTMWTTSIELTENNLRGSLPSEMSELLLLTSLRFARNEVTGTLPEELMNLSNLFQIDMTSNNITGDFNPELFTNSSTSLDMLVLESNLLQGSIPESIEMLTNLEVMILSSNQMDGSLPDELGKLTGLRVLELANNTFDGEIPADLGKLSRLEVLDLTGNQFTGAMPDNICEDLVFLAVLLVDCSEDLDIDNCSCCLCEPLLDDS